MRPILLTAALLLVVALACPTSGATLLAHYDVADPASFSGGVLQDLTGNHADLTPGTGNGGAGFVAPSFVPGGPGTRAFLDFTGFGVLDGGSLNPSAFSAGGLVGYSMEGYFRVGADFAAQSNTGIGGSQTTSSENQFVAFKLSTAKFHSETTIDTSSTGGFDPQRLDSDIDAIVPVDAFFHLVKVHDPFTNGGEVRFYIDGELVKTDEHIVASPVEYHSRGEVLGVVGSNGREVEGLGYSMTRFYTGVLTDAEIAQNFASVAGVPEPSALALLVGAGVTAAARRRRRDGR